MTEPEEPPALPFELQDGEQVVELCRRHWLFLWPKVVLFALVAIVPVALAWFIAAGIAGLGSAAALVLAVLSLAWLGYWGARTVLAWYRYKHDIWVVTNQRLIDSHKRHWFHHQMASADLVDVEDMFIQREGVLSTVFNFGDVRCQTAGAQSNFVLANIPRPADVLRAVDAARDASRREYYLPR